MSWMLGCFAITFLCKDLGTIIQLKQPLKNGCLGHQVLYNMDPSSPWIHHLASPNWIRSPRWVHARDIRLSCGGGWLFYLEAYTPENLTWQWKNDPFEVPYPLLKMVMFQCHLSLQLGVYYPLSFGGDCFISQLIRIPEGETIRI